MWTFSIFCGLVASRLRSREVRSDVIRKSFNTIGHLGPALALIGLSFSGCNRSLVIFWFCLAVMLNGAANSGFQVKNHRFYHMSEKVSWPLNFQTYSTPSQITLKQITILVIYISDVGIHLVTVEKHAIIKKFDDAWQNSSKTKVYFSLGHKNCTFRL